MAKAWATIQGPNGPEEPPDEPVSAPDRPWQDADDWLDGLPLCWQQKWLEAPTAQMFPLEVSSALLQVLSEEREKADGAVCLSWLELTVMLHVLGFLTRLRSPSVVVQCGRCLAQFYRLNMGR